MGTRPRHIMKDGSVITAKDVNRVFYDVTKTGIKAYILVCKRKIIRSGRWRGSSEDAYDLPTARWKRNPEGDIF